MPHTTYESTTIHYHRERDDYQHGCDPSDTCATTYRWDIVSDTLQGYLDQLCQHALWTDHNPEAVCLNACDEPGRVDVAVMVNSENHPASKRELAAWKRGECVLYYATYTAHVDAVTREVALMAL